MLKAIYEINVGGNNVSDSFNPILEQLSVSLQANATSDTASLVIADLDGSVLMPSKNDPITILLGMRDKSINQVFEGTVSDVRSHGSRGGRMLTIEAKGFDDREKAKEPLEFHKDDSSLEDFMSEAAGKAGLSFSAQGDVSAIQRKYWAAQTESFIHLGQRVAREIGANFKIIGTTGYMWPRNTAMFDGAVTATWGDNLIDWDIAPIVSRPRFGTARSRWYDRLEAQWKETTQSIGLGDAVHTDRFFRPDEDQAGGVATNNERESQREAGSGTVNIVGEPAAMPEGNCTVAGARPGVDGDYRIDTVNHSISRSGFTTSLSLKQPQGSAGTDSRGGEGE